MINKRVECIDNSEGVIPLKIGKFYNIGKENDACFWIINDRDEIQWYLKKRFKVEQKYIFDIEEFRNKDIAINCETEDEANKLFEILKDYDLPKGKQNHNEETCYRFHDDGILQADCDFYKKREYEIYKFSDVDFSNVSIKESIDKVEFDITKAKYITIEQLFQRDRKSVV